MCSKVVKSKDHLFSFSGRISKAKEAYIKNEKHQIE